MRAANAADVEVIERNPCGERRRPFRDPICLIDKCRTKLNTFWLKTTYPFSYFGENASIHHSCDIDRGVAQKISLGNHVYLAPDVWLNVECHDNDPEPVILLGDGSRVGRRSTISAKNSIVLEEDVLVAPSVLIMDHNHEYSNPSVPIHAQGTTPGGTIVIGRNSWLGYGAVVFCSRAKLELGRNCVVGALSVVTCGFPANSVVAGNPARLIKRFDQTSGLWVKSDEREVGDTFGDTLKIYPPRP